MRKSEGFLSYFGKMKDLRADKAKKHILGDIMFITIAAILSGAETWNDIEDYGNAKLEWLKTQLSLPNGIPSHDTFNRVFSALDPVMFEQCFLKWVKSIQKSSDGGIIAIDGKTMRGSKKAGGKYAAHIVSAWCDKNDLILGQIKVDEKSNEITAIPQLINMLFVEGSVVTIDAMGCQKKIAKKIIKKNADYVLALKGNQKDLLDDVKDSFRSPTLSRISKDLDFGHGRIEKRKCTIITDLELVVNSGKWEALKSIIKMERERTHKKDGKVEYETSYYISSLDDPEQIATAIRKHWGIENKVHWILDVSFNEDYSRKRNNNAAENFSKLNRIALNILKTDDKKASMKRKRLTAGWNNDYMTKLLGI